MQVTEKMLRIEKVKPTGGGAKIVTDVQMRNATDVVRVILVMHSREVLNLHICLKTMWRFTLPVSA